MPLVSTLSVALLQASALPDTIIARTVPVRGVFEYSSGILQILVLVLGAGVLVALVMLLVAVRKGVEKLNDTIDKLGIEVRPLIKNANEVVGDARKVVTRVRQDVERVSSAASAVSDQLLYAAEVTADRVDDVNAVLDVLQDELEDMAISTVATARGVSVGAQMLSAAFGRRKPGLKRSAKSLERERRREEARREDAARDGARFQESPAD